MLSELNKVSQRIDRLLADDPLPDQIRPGYLLDAVRAYPARGGKRLRPALVTWFCGLVGGNPDHALRTGFAVELFHSWTLIHDDIIDDDESRRGADACHVLLRKAAQAEFGTAEDEATAFGVKQAILAGDILHGWALNALTAAERDGVQKEVVLALLRRLTGWVTPQLISGEALDVEFELRPHVAQAEMENMVLMKTGVLLQFCAQAGVMIGKKTPEWADADVDRAGEFGTAAGVAFQLQDDILGVFGNPATTGKPVCSDIVEGKKTFLLESAWQRADAGGRDRLAGLAGHGPLETANVVAARALCEETGALAATRTAAAAYAARARQSLAGFAENRYAKLLADWLEFVVARAH